MNINASREKRVVRVRDFGSKNIGDSVPNLETLSYAGVSVLQMRFWAHNFTRSNLKRSEISLEKL